MRHRHFSIDVPPSFCEECGKRWSAVLDGREGRRLRRITLRGPVTAAGRRLLRTAKTESSLYAIGEAAEDLIPRIEAEAAGAVHTILAAGLYRISSDGPPTWKGDRRSVEDALGRVPQWTGTVIADDEP